VGSDLSDPDFGDEMFDIVDKVTATAKGQQQHTEQADLQDVDTMLSEAKRVSSSKKPLPSLHVRMQQLGQLGTWFCSVRRV
jgi:hypothetical protein